MPLDEPPADGSTAPGDGNYHDFARGKPSGENTALKSKRCTLSSVLERGMQIDQS